MVKYFKTVGTQLERSKYERLIKICEREGCKPYALIKELLLGYLESYPLDEAHQTPQKTLEEIGGGLNDPSRRKD